MSIDQLRLDAHAISGALHAALDDGSDTQRRADLAQIARAFLVLEYRRSRYHLKIPEPRHLPQQLIVKPIGEVRRVPLAAQTRERQHRN